MNPRQQGFTLLEVVTALAVLSLIAIGGIRASESYYRDADYRLLERNAMLVMSALNGYYDMQCSNISFNPAPSIDQLVGLGLLENSTYAENPFGPELTVNIDKILMVKARVSGVSASRLYATVAATRYSGGELVWESAPTALTATDNVYNMQLKHMYEPGVCQ